MLETVGTLNLKIARLERRLQVLRQQQLLSIAYPAHQAELTRESLWLQSILSQLSQYRQELSQKAMAA